MRGSGDNKVKGLQDEPLVGRRPHSQRKQVKGVRHQGKKWDPCVEEKNQKTHKLKNKDKHIKKLGGKP